MKISEKTINILKNFSTINQSILFKSGCALSTISPTSTILAYANVDEEFDSEFAIYDLNRFIAVLSLFDDPDIEIKEKVAVINQDKKKLTYTFANPSMIITPPNIS